MTHFLEHECTAQPVGGDEGEQSHVVNGVYAGGEAFAVGCLIREEAVAAVEAAHV